MERTSARIMGQGNRRGFTLVEMSIVLVIIGLVVGGIVVGREMIAQALLRQIFTKPQELIIATNNFRLKYNAFPGDMPNATQFWGSVTYNGNGNGFITGDGEQPSGHSELWHAFRHLSLAGLYPLDPPWPVAGGLDTDGEILDVYIPGIKGMSDPLGSGRVGIMFSGLGLNGSTRCPNNTIRVGTGEASLGYNAYRWGFLRNSQILAIDRKYDDGDLYKGMMLNGLIYSCADSSTQWTCSVRICF